MDLQLFPSDDPLLARALTVGEQAWRRGALAQAHALLRLALVRALACGNPAGALSAHQLLAHVAFDAGAPERARGHHCSVLELSEQLALPLGIASSLHNLGLIAAAGGEEGVARQLIGDAIARYEAFGHAAGALAARANLARFVAHWAQRSGGPDAER